jgi:CRISPR-associated protein (TIGR02710 family)
MKRALLLTVGTTADSKNDIVEALVADIKTCKPDFVSLFATELSHSNAEKIVEQTQLREGSYEIVRLESPHDLDEVFRKVNAAIRRLTARGYSASNISINYTSGTKVMSSGAVLSAVFNACERLRYIFAGQKNQANKKHILTSPQAIFAFRDVMLAKTLIQEMRFMSARDVLAAIDRSLLTQVELTLMNNLDRLAVAYHQWDNFHHHDFLDLYAQVQFGDAELEVFRLSGSQRALLEQVAGSISSEEFAPALFADMFNNAIRRMIEGRYDDAIARLYRVTEMLAQWVLATRYGISTENVDTRRAPPKQRPTFEALRSVEDGHVKIGLRKAYELLAALGAPLGAAFVADTEMHELFVERGRSILAHGIQPGTALTCQHFIKWAASMMSREIDDFLSLASSLQFPWLQEKQQQFV